MITFWTKNYNNYTGKYIATKEIVYRAPCHDIHRLNYSRRYALSKCLFFSVCLSVSLSVWQSVDVSSCRSVSVSICPCVDLSMYRSVYVSICLCRSVCVDLSMCRSVCVDLSMRRSVSVLTCLSVDLSMYRSVYVSICLCVDLFMYRSVYVSICLCIDLSKCRSVYLPFLTLLARHLRTMRTRARTNRTPPHTKGNRWNILWKKQCNHTLHSNLSCINNSHS